MRLFVSVDLDGLAEGVADAQARLPDTGSLRPVDPEGAHVTLKFLGEVDPDRVDTIQGALTTAITDADVSPFEMVVGDFGVFPSLDYISVVWAGVREGGSALTRLHEAVERETTALGFDPEDHEFTPHVTLARMDDARGKEAVQRVVREADPTVGRMDVTEVRLTKSTLTDDGPEYETVARFPLSA
ncbi:RNA 2',3'-cyclic phosphodiesterase [Haloplanus aerogenes]|uniref:RNA 2',3'-cyclic phosphodiesterase n=1 Tax=Haloplanus aerogenes TaxID=660522 RepID=A0A3M0CX45_9EURY|nr:RNA 2',3'-cyclic phosphodiesterase [Haloplanus aerogenes]AZH26986.1 RNA 2',3'-cyclic phosphodiesterase [Haloplanus aerogenes]RMB13524.1 2'-5' RNA ligase [Haloplanus aerogenes]